MIENILSKLGLQALTKRYDYAHVLVLLYLLIFLIDALVLIPIFSWRTDTDTDTVAVASSIEMLKLLLICAPLSLLGLARADKPVALKWWLLLPIFTVLFRIALIALSFISKLLPSEDTLSQIQTSDISPTIFMLVISMLLVCFIAPISEELIFRKYLLPATPSWLAVFINGILFSLVHPWQNFSYHSWISHLNLAIMGWALAFTMKRTQNIKFTIFFHILINLFAYAISIR